MKIKALLFALLAFTVAMTATLTVYATDGGITPALDGIAIECGMVKSAPRGEDFEFSVSDFRRALGTSKFDSITVTALPESSDGVLKLSGLRVTEGQRIDVAELGALVFTPASSLFDGGSFCFACEDLSGTDITCSLRAVEGENRSPSVSAVASVRLNAWTQKNLPCSGRVSASDPDGDAISYQVVKYPRKGSLVMESDGSYVYTPKKNYTGEDSFTYVARDEYGNYSKVATVSVSVVRRLSDVEYSDVERATDANVLSALTASGIVGGRISGDSLLFEPEVKVSRSEFTVMAMKAAGVRPIGEAGVTYFDDDDEIPAGERPYIALAQRMGYINGSFEGDGLYFRPCDDITAAEAAVIVGKILGISGSGVSPAFAPSDAVPGWASVPASALCDAGVIDESWLSSSLTTRTLTRLDAAEVLFQMMRYNELK